MCSFITQHNATDITSFEVACNWYADCRNVHQSCCLLIECKFLYHKPSPKAFQRIWQYIQPASQPQTMCIHTSPGPPYPVSSPPRSSETSHPDSCCCGQWKQVHFIDAILNAQTYRDEILRPIVVPFIHDHHLMLQHDNARPHVTRICTQFLEVENIPVLAWPAYSPDMSPIEHVWDALDRRIWQRVPVPANIQQLRTAIEEEWTNIQQATINNLINSMRRRWQMVVTSDTDWFSEPPGPPQYSKTAHFRVAFYCGQPKAHLCNNHAV